MCGETESPLPQDQLNAAEARIRFLQSLYANGVAISESEVEELGKEVSAWRQAIHDAIPHAHTVLPQAPQFDPMEVDEGDDSAVLIDNPDVAYVNGDDVFSDDAASGSESSEENESAYEPPNHTTEALCDNDQAAPLQYRRITRLMANEPAAAQQSACAAVDTAAAVRGAPPDISDAPDDQADNDVVLERVDASVTEAHRQDRRRHRLREDDAVSDAAHDAQFASSEEQKDNEPHAAVEGRYGACADDEADEVVQDASDYDESEQELLNHAEDDAENDSNRPPTPTPSVAESQIEHTETDGNDTSITPLTDTPSASHHEEAASSASTTDKKESRKRRREEDEDDSSSKRRRGSSSASNARSNDGRPEDDASSSAAAASAPRGASVASQPSNSRQVGERQLRRRAARRRIHEVAQDIVTYCLQMYQQHGNQGPQMLDIRVPALNFSKKAKRNKKKILRRITERREVLQQTSQLAWRTRIQVGGLVTWLFNVVSTEHSGWTVEQVWVEVEELCGLGDGEGRMHAYLWNLHLGHPAVAWFAHAAEAVGFEWHWGTVAGFICDGGFEQAFAGADGAAAAAAPCRDASDHQ